MIEPESAGRDQWCGNGLRNEQQRLEVDAAITMS